MYFFILENLNISWESGSSVSFYSRHVIKPGVLKGCIIIMIKCTFYYKYTDLAFLELSEELQCVIISAEGSEEVYTNDFLDS